MKKFLTFLALVSLFLFYGCNETSSTHGPNYQILCKRGCIIHVIGDTYKWAEQAKKKYSEEDYNEVIADGQYYDYEAIEFLKNKDYFKKDGFKYFEYRVSNESDMIKIREILDHSEVLLDEFDDVLYAFIFYRTGKMGKPPEIIYPIAVREQFSKYFDYNKNY